MKKITMSWDGIEKAKCRKLAINHGKRISENGAMIFFPSHEMRCVKLAYDSGLIKKDTHLIFIDSGKDIPSSELQKIWMQFVKEKGIKKYHFYHGLLAEAEDAIFKILEPDEKISFAFYDLCGLMNQKTLQTLYRLSERYANRAVISYTLYGADREKKFYPEFKKILNEETELINEINKKFLKKYSFDFQFDIDKLNYVCSLIATGTGAYHLYQTRYHDINKPIMDFCSFYVNKDWKKANLSKKKLDNFINKTKGIERLSNHEKPFDSCSFDKVTRAGNKDHLHNPILLNKHKNELAELEKVIDKGLSVFWQVGMAISKIRRKKLWKLTGDENFTAYLLRRFGFGKSYASKLETGASIYNKLLSYKKENNKSWDLPQTNSVYYELANYGDTQKQVEIIDAVLIESKVLTVPNIQSVVSGFITEKPKEQTELNSIKTAIGILSKKAETLLSLPDDDLEALFSAEQRSIMCDLFKNLASRLQN